MNNIIIFVYGSLRKGCYNNHYLTNCEYIDSIKLTGFKLYKLCESYPAAVKTNNDNDQIVADVYKIDQLKLNQLDLLESHPEYYERVQIYNKQLNLTGWIYCVPISDVERIQKKCFFIENGNWIKHYHHK